MIKVLEMTVPSTPQEREQISKEIDLMKKKKLSILRKPTQVETSLKYKNPKSPKAPPVAGQASPVFFETKVEKLDHSRSQELSPAGHDQSSFIPYRVSTPPHVAVSSQKTEEKLSPFPNFADNRLDAFMPFTSMFNDIPWSMRLPLPQLRDDMSAGHGTFRPRLPVIEPHVILLPPLESKKAHPGHPQ